MENTDKDFKWSSQQVYRFGEKDTYEIQIIFTKKGILKRISIVYNVFKM